MAQIEFVGVDGCPRGWFSVGFGGGGYALNVFATFGELVDYYNAAKLILVDMPIGLPEGQEERLCDPEAKRMLGHPGQASVFRAPTRQATEYLADNPGDSDGVKAVQIKITGRSLSNQAIAIMPKIAEVDRVMLDWQPRVREVHPEICFWALNNRQPTRCKKKIREGIEGRLCVLERVEPITRDIFEAGCTDFYRKDVARDDILDALAAAVTAYRGWPGQLQTLSQNNGPQTDGKGLRMEMVYWVP